MSRVHCVLASLALAGVLASPMLGLASPAPQDDRVYDRSHKDYHHWDDHEKDAWGRFLAENHRKDHEFAKANRKEQAEYWNWRHSHPD